MSARHSWGIEHPFMLGDRAVIIRGERQKCPRILQVAFTLLRNVERNHKSVLEHPSARVSFIPSCLL